MNTLDFYSRKSQNQKITMVTCYDFSSAQILATSNVDCILVGDSVAMMMHGHSTTIPADIAMMAAHVRAVAKGAGDKFIVADMPFLATRRSLSETMDAVAALMQAGAHAVKIEGVVGHEEHIVHIVTSGVPVMGHLGLTPQSVHQLGGFRVQGKGDSEANRIKLEAQRIVDLGCFAMVLECIPANLAGEITQAVPIATIGIGAGNETDGQVLVWQDLLGLNGGYIPKFVKSYLNGQKLVQDALNGFDRDVKSRDFPSREHCYRVSS